MHLYIQVERSLYCIYRRRIRIHVSIYIYTVDLQLETITQILLCKRQPGCSVKKSIYKCEIKDGVPVPGGHLAMPLPRSAWVNGANSCIVEVS
jgi:hypothetical protein